MTAAGRTLVVGLGSSDRGDDAIGAAVVRQLRSLGMPGIDLVERDEPIRLLDLWGDYDRVVVVDAVRSNTRPGAVLVRDATRAPVPSAPGASSHVLGLTDVVQLARAVGRLPASVVLVGVEAADVGVGRPMSAAVQAAVDPAVRAVVQCVVEAGEADV